MRPPVLAPLVIVLAFLARDARADMLPDPDSADAHCTLPEQCPDGAECPYGLRREAGVTASCQTAQEAKGMAYRCHRDGNYQGTAVYCRPGTHGSWSADGHAGCSRCAVSPETQPDGFSLLLGVAAVLLGFSRARRSATTAA